MSWIKNFYLQLVWLVPALCFESSRSCVVPFVLFYQKILLFGSMLRRKGPKWPIIAPVLVAEAINSLGLLHRPGITGILADVPWLEDTSNAGVVETAARIMEILDRRKVP